MRESIQHKLDRVRKPRVQITYDVEIGGAIEKKELAFVMGILADLSGMPENPLPSINLRKFVEIDRDNFTDVMRSINPHLHLVIPNKLDEKQKELACDLCFQEIEDFEPLNLTKQIPELKEFYETRCRLKDIFTKMDGNEALEEMMTQILVDPKALAAIKKELASAKPKKVPQEKGGK